MERLQDQIDRAVFVVEHPLPREGGNVLGHRPGKNEKRPEPRPPPDFLIQEYREADAEDQVRRAERDLAAAREVQERVDAEVRLLWQELRGRLGSAGRRAGGPPGPVGGATGDPLPMLTAVRDLLARTGQPGELPGSVNPLLALCGVGGALVAYALGTAARTAGDRYGGDLAVGLPVLALVVTLLGPLVGLVPAKVLADRRHAVLGPRPATIVAVAGLATTVLLLTLVP